MFETFDATWRQPDSVTCFLEVPDARVQALTAHLSTLNLHGPLAALGSLHAFRAFVIPATADVPARLVVNTVFDGELDAFHVELVEHAGAELLELLSHCAYPPHSKADIAHWLTSRSTRPQLTHIGAPTATLKVQREEAALAQALQDFFDAELARGALQDADPAQIRNAARRYVLSRPDLPGGPRPGVGLARKLSELASLLRVVAVFTGIPLLLGLSILPVGGWLLVWTAVGTLLGIGLLRLLPRLFVQFEPRVDVHPLPAQVARLVAREDLGLKNQFTMLSTVRDSWFRRFNLGFTLFAGQVLVRHWWTVGRLAGVDTIHVARIHQIDEGRRMLFMSEFDGSWDRYLFDFLTVGNFAVVPIWTNNEGCPNPGDPDFAQRFLPFTRACQLDTDYWYSAMPNLSVAEIHRNAAIRAGLFRDGNAPQLRAWLGLFG